MKYGSSSEKEHQKLKFELTVGLSPSKKKNLFASMKALWKGYKCFLFHLKSSFGSQDF